MEDILIRLGTIIGIGAGGGLFFLGAAKAIRAGGDFFERMRQPTNGGTTNVGQFVQVLTDTSTAINTIKDEIVKQTGIQERQVAIAEKMNGKLSKLNSIQKMSKSTLDLLGAAEARQIKMYKKINKQ